MDTIASRLRTALEMRGMKQAELVELTGIGKSSISTYLRGSYIPKQKNIYKMAKALNVNEAWLMGEDVDPTRQNAYSEPSDSSLVTIHYAGPVAAHFDATPLMTPTSSAPSLRVDWTAPDLKISFWLRSAATVCTLSSRTAMKSCACDAATWAFPAGSALCCWAAMKPLSSVSSISLVRIGLISFPSTRNSSRGVLKV